MIPSDELKKFRSQLEDRRQQLLDQIEDLEEALAYLDQSRPPEFSEEAQEKAVASSLLALDEQERRELSAIVIALQKMEDGSYGKCEKCGRWIDLARLSALPMVRTCIHCQKKTETNE